VRFDLQKLKYHVGICELECITGNHIQIIDISLPYPYNNEQPLNKMKNNNMQSQLLRCTKEI